MYRNRKRICPGCDGPMTEVAMSPESEGDDAVTIDRCPACGGVFLDFFDGEPAQLASRLVEADDAERGGATPALGAVRCPDCGAQMVPDDYLGSGPELRRCPSCMGLWAAPEELRALAQFELPVDTPPDGLYARLKALITSSWRQ